MAQEPDLGAIRARWHIADGSGWGTDEALVRYAIFDIMALLVLVDTQTTRLAATQPVADAALAWLGARGHPFEAEATAELMRVVTRYRESGAWMHE